MDQENEQSTNTDMSLSNSQEYNQKENQLEMEVTSSEEKQKQSQTQPLHSHLIKSLVDTRISTLPSMATAAAAATADTDTDTFHLHLPMQDLIYYPEYSQQILQAWLHLETLPWYTLSSDFLSCTSIQYNVLKQMRVTLMDWLISIQVYLSISNETLQLTLNITDRYTAISPTSLAKNNYQLIGLAALSVSIKFEEIAVPSLKLLCDLADNSYTTQQLVAMEKQIYFSLECYISNPQPIHFLRYFSILLSRGPLEHSLAKYFLELSILQQSDLAHMRASIRAAVSLSLSSQLLVDSSHVLHRLSLVLEMEQRELQDYVDSLKIVVRRVTRGKGEGLFVYQKYSEKKLSKVSTLQCLKDL